MTRIKNTYLAALAVLLSPMVANADLITWNTDGVVFDDGTSLTGSFNYDAGTNTYSDWNLSVLDGTLSAYNYLPGNGFVGSRSALTVDFVSLPPETAGRYLRFVFDSALTDAGGYIALAAGSVECDNCSTSRLIVSGAVTTVPVPEPGTLALLGLGLAGIGFARRKKV